MSDWYDVVVRAEWNRFADVRKTFNTADKVGAKTVFDVGGNHYRIITFIDYERQQVFIRAVLDHKEYDKGNWKKDTFGNDWKPFMKMIRDHKSGERQ